MITAHWFSYSGDQDILPLSIMAFSQHRPDARLVVVDDGLNPCSEATCKKCESMGVEWRVSTWKRDGNLNGTDCILGILTEMQKSVNKGAKTCLKIDCDTLVLRSPWLADFEGMIGADDRGGVYGCCYALRDYSVTSLCHSFSTTPARQEEPEDMIVALRYIALFGDTMIRLPLKKQEIDKYGNGPNGIVIPYKWGCSPALYSKYDVINCGNLMSENGIIPKKRSEIMRCILGCLKQRPIV